MKRSDNQQVHQYLQNGQPNITYNNKIKRSNVRIHQLPLYLTKQYIPQNK
jgi:hypothetical protein